MKDIRRRGAAFVAGSRSPARVAAGDCGPADAAWSVLEGRGKPPPYWAF